MSTGWVQRSAVWVSVSAYEASERRKSGMARCTALGS